MENHDYHNYGHGCQVYSFTRILLEMLKDVASADKLVTLTGALLHDYGHCGAPYRQVLLPFSWLSNEEFACWDVDDLVSPVFSTGYRLQLQGIILSTSFGQNNRRVSDPLYRPYRPITLWERIVALADVSVAFSNFPEFLRSATLLALELGKSNYQEVSEFLLGDGQLQFIGMVQSRLDDLVELPAGEIEGFGRRLEDNRSELIRLGEHPELLVKYNNAIASAGVYVE
jgi:hypothetical protein